MAVLEQAAQESYHCNKAVSASTSSSSSTRCRRYETSRLIASQRHKLTRLSPFVLVETLRADDLTYFMHHICEEEVHLSTPLNMLGSVMEMTSNLIEPVCRRMEQAALAGIIPNRIRCCLSAVGKAESFVGISARALLAEYVVPNVLSFVKAVLDRAIAENQPIQQVAEEGGRVDEEEEALVQQVRSLTERVEELFYFVFDISGSESGSFARNHPKLCLAEVAGLSRSKWYITRSGHPNCFSAVHNELPCGLLLL